MSELAVTYNFKKNWTLRIFQKTNIKDDCGVFTDAPFGVAACFHAKHKLGSKNHEYTKLNEINLDDYAVALPLYFCEQGDTQICLEALDSNSSSIQVGLFLVTEDEVIDEFGSCDEESIKMTKELVKFIISSYNEVLKGRVYHFVLDYGKEVVDRMAGFIGDCEDLEKIGMLDYLPEEVRYLYATDRFKKVA